MSIVKKNNKLANFIFTGFIILVRSIGNIKIGEKIEVNIQTNMTFGAKVPTKTVLGLASNRSLYDEAWYDNIRTIEKLAGRGSMNGMASMGTVITFEAVGNVIRKLFPELQSFLKDVEGLRNIKKSKYDKELNKIFKAAEDKFGKEMDVPEEEIEKIVKSNGTPLHSFLSGNLY